MNKIKRYVDKLMNQYNRLSHEQLKEELEYLKSLDGKNVYRAKLINEIEKVIV